MSSYANRLRNIAQMNKKMRRDRPKDPEDTGLIIREAIAHNNGVAKMSPHDFGGLITVGKHDCQVRIWSYSLDLWGVIDGRTYEQDVLWYFPATDKESSQLKDIHEMQKMVDELRE